jgi:hypothetical protein
VRRFYKGVLGSLYRAPEMVVAYSYLTNAAKREFGGFEKFRAYWRAIRARGGLPISVDKVTITESECKHASYKGKIVFASVPQEATGELAQYGEHWYLVSGEWTTANKNPEPIPA